MRSDAPACLANNRASDLAALGLAPDAIEFGPPSKASPASAPDTAGAGGESELAFRALWLRNVQTQPADFLRAKFAYQHSAAQSGAEDGP